MGISLSIVLGLLELEVGFLAGVLLEMTRRRQDAALLAQALTCIKLALLLEISRSPGDVGNASAAHERSDVHPCAERSKPRSYRERSFTSQRGIDILSPAGKAISRELDSVIAPISRQV
jgi:hypothetical protein